MKKFAATSNNFYRTSQEDPEGKDNGGSLQSRQIQNNQQNTVNSYYNLAKSPIN